jgi:hypothetical protein
MGFYSRPTHTVPTVHNLSDEDVQFILELWNKDCPADIICDHFEEQDLGPDEIMDVLQKHYYKV